MNLRCAVLAMFALAAVLAGCVGPVRNQRVPQPIRAVVTSRYLGRWYEVARYDKQFEDGCAGVTADYTLRQDGRIGVLNTCRKGGPQGRRETIEGVATLVPDSGGAKLKVAFFNGLVRGDYWVLNHDDAYSWAVVGEPSGRFLWLLSRTPLTGPDREALIARAVELGYPARPLHLTAQAGEAQSPR